MPLDHDDSEARTRRLEEYARAHPRAYRLRVVALAAFGYAYLAMVLAALGAALALLVRGVRKADGGGVLIGKIGLPILGLMVLVLRALWVRITPPDGMRLDARNAPELVAEVERVRCAVAGPAVHRILLTDDFNAGVSQVPRLGLFGWPRNYVMIGLPLL